MNFSGLLWSDGLFVCLILYGGLYGWVVTLAGWAICLFTGIAYGRWRAAVGCALLGLLPALYIIALFALASFPERKIALVPASAVASLVMLAGMVIAIFACPLAAVSMAWREHRARSGVGTRNVR